MTGAEFGGVDFDLLADYIGGALTGTPEESAVAGRVADDPAWQAAYASLSAGMAFVSAELGRFEPEPMPAELTARLDAAFAEPAEADSTARPTYLDLVAQGVEADPESRGEAAVSHDEREPIGAGAVARPAAAHLTLVGDGVAGGDVPDPVRKKAPAPPRGRRLRWAAPIAVAAGVIAFVGFGLDYLAGRSSSTSTSGAGLADKGAAAPAEGRAPLATAQILASGTDYTRATLGLAPVSPMTAPFTSEVSPGASPPVHRASPGLAAGGSSALQRLTGPAALDDCLAKIEQANANGAISVESVDYARFRGAPAVIVRFTAANGHWAWASGADCGTPAGGAATLDKVPVG